ncbi:MAG: thiol peroxidase [Chlamydiales bacterium]|nr:thiol peroxidase [Chlamydiales bacterium]
MAETVKLRGKPFELKGDLVKVGEEAPDCLLTNVELEDVKLSSFTGKGFLIMSIPSLDTPVCSKEAHRFNQELGRFGKDLVAIAVSMDLPFAQKRWCATEDIDNLITLSDYKLRDFGEKFGLLVPDLGLLARSVYILDRHRKVIYAHLVKETTEEPPYEEILEELTLRLG